MSQIDINPKIVQKLSEQNLSKSLYLIAFDWISIAIIIYFTKLYFNPLTYLLAVMLIANRQHGLLILMHDCSHNRFTNNNKLNDLLGDFFTAWPLFIQMKAYREKHNAHHRYSNTSNDPDFILSRYPKFRFEIYKMLIMDFLALNTFAQFKQIGEFQIQTTIIEKTLRAMFYITALALIIYLGVYKSFLLFWIVPAFTWLKVCLRLRSISDHSGLQHLEGPFDTRTVVPNIFDLLFIAPHDSSYHFSHHAFGAVPCYNLKKMHKEIMNSKDADRVHVTNGYFNLFSEFPMNENQIADVEKKMNVSFSINMPTT